MNIESSTDQQAFQIKVINRSESFICHEGQSLLAGMEYQQAQCIEVGCRGGGCGMCKIKVLQGEFNSKRMSKAHINEEERAAGFVLACRIFPSTDMRIESDHFEINTAANAVDTRPKAK